ncbi:hypothetical protein SAMD00019534_067690 [Acytostelium subglobosum LB1]|uniref:hypothetical protein n=1 Tax=Acytostelium subglobosum LB1 TaxID=1410327 RepID=UPI000644D312|nr:hypothetical protein SAMD00019534_067690 [Acytostelium subglobosum LB1]GAM23594.1 hypothetical protein SAMD00019534_067690 [Acytostelium subglobosum LB1]|eukprot:XP_012753335.1 hypothetical protein SAMD00019534_067690 [Acytostelium subglobosum LB1]
MSNLQRSGVITFTLVVLLVALIGTTSAISDSQWTVLNSFASNLGFKWPSKDCNVYGVYTVSSRSYNLNSYIGCDNSQNLINLTLEAAPASNKLCRPLSGNAILDSDNWSTIDNLKTLNLINVDLSSSGGIPSKLYDSEMGSLYTLSITGICKANFNGGVFTERLDNLYVENALGTFPNLTAATNLYNFALTQSPSDTLKFILSPSLFTSSMTTFKLILTSQPSTIVLPGSILNAQNLINKSTKLTSFIINSPGFSTNFNSFFTSVPNTLTFLSMSGLTLSDQTTLPDVPPAKWSNLKGLALERLGLTGTLNNNYFLMSNLTSLSLMHNPALAMTIPTQFGSSSNIKSLYLSDTNISGQLQENILDNGLTTLYLTTVNGLKNTLLPTAFLCLPPSYFTGLTIPAYIFDNVTFTNYQGPDTPRSCEPSITFISNPISSNLTFFTVVGINFGDKPNIKMVSGNDQYIVNNNNVNASALLCITPVFLQGAGTLYLTQTYGALKTATIPYSFMIPSITSISSPPTLGGFVTLTGYDLLPFTQPNAIGTYVMIGNTPCTNLTSVDVFKQMSCLVPPGITSNVQVLVSIKGLSSDPSTTPNFFYRAPTVQTANAMSPDKENAMTITGSDFWTDINAVNVTVQLGAQLIQCNVTYVNHSIIYCTFPSVGFVAGTHNIQVAVADQPSFPNSLFSFVDIQLCPDSCGGSAKGECNVGFGLCNCKNVAGPSCSEGAIPSTLQVNTTAPVLSISSPDSTTTLNAYLVSVYENGAETKIANWQQASLPATRANSFTWTSGSRQIVVIIRPNNASTPADLVGPGALLNVFDNTFTYQVSYQSKGDSYNDVGFKFQFDVFPTECSAPPIHVAYPAQGLNTSVHWLTLTKFNTSWFARLPQVASINGNGGSISSTLGVRDGTTTNIVADVNNYKEPISSVNFEFDFSALTASGSAGRVPVTTNCPSNQPGDNSSGDKGGRGGGTDNKWKVTVGVVVAVVGTAIIAAGGFFIWRQHRNLEQTKSLLDKKLKEINANL